MGPVVVIGNVHTARKQHQRKNIPICASRPASCVDWALRRKTVRERTEDLCVEVHEPGGGGVHEAQHGAGVEGAAVQVVVQRPVLHVVRDEPQLRARVATRHVRRQEAQDILVPQ